MNFIDLQQYCCRALCAVVFVCLLGGGVTKAEHFSGASLTYENVGPNFYMIYMDLYLDCSGTPITPQVLRFKSTCGTQYELTGLSPNFWEEVSPLCPAQIQNSTCNGGWLPSYRRYRYEIMVYLATCVGTWNVNWYICCRNTMVNVVNEPGTYVELTMNNSISVNGVVGADKSPQFPVSTIPYICVNEPFSHNPGVTDDDPGHTMVYSLIDARFGSPTPFPVTYASGYTGAQPIQGLSFDPASGQISGIPTQIGNYTVVFKVTSYDQFGTLLGTVMRDQMFIVYVCDEAPPVTTGISNTSPGVFVGPNSVGPCNGTYFCFDVQFTDDNPDSDISILSDAQTVLPGSTLTISGTNPAIATFCWTANTSMLPTNIFLYATDGACPIENVASRAIYLNDCLILPIQLVSFTALVDKHMVRTAWTTASERDNDHFTVERSVDGSHYETVGIVKAVGNSQTLVDYAFDDTDPLPGTSYYRLRQTDLDGTYTFSDVVPVNFLASERIIATADGAMGWIVTRLPVGGEWTLVDLLGRAVSHGSLDDSGMLRLPVEGMPPGLNLLLVQGEFGEQHVLKIPAFGAHITGMTISSGQ